ncbi:MAG: hypothetical protein JW384_00280 [Nitrosomonadaceae bacterium]|nr:hypothetical protein [Nitrosomonadaceae bacterium]
MIAIRKNARGNRVRTIACNNSNYDRNAIIVDGDGSARFSAASKASNGKRVIAGDFIDSTCSGVLRYRTKGGRSGGANVDGVSAYRCRLAFIASGIGAGDA